ncbi:MAG: FtsX-like permease family protein, partial [Pseudomonadota bacterium]
VPSRGWSATLTTLTAMAMSFLAVLSLVAGLGAGRLASAWQSDLAGQATVSVMSAPGAEAATLTRIIEVLEQTPGIRALRVLSDDEHAALLAPWLGEEAVLDDLPAPRLIELTLARDGPDVPGLSARLEQTAPGTLYDDHQSWRTPLLGAASTLQWLSWMATLLVVAAAAGMIGLAAQATLAGNTEIVKVVRLIGAEDRFIARAFVSRIALRGFAGGAIGTGLALGTLALLPDLGLEAQIGLSLELGPLTTLLLLIAVPFGAMAVAFIAAQASIRSALSRMW